MSRTALTLYLAGLVWLAGCGIVTRDDGGSLETESVYQTAGQSARAELGKAYADVYDGAADKLEQGESSSDAIADYLKAELPKARARALEQLENDMGRWCPRNRPMTRDDAKVYRGIGKGWRS